MFDCYATLTAPMETTVQQLKRHDYLTKVIKLIIEVIVIMKLYVSIKTDF